MEEITVTVSVTGGEKAIAAFTDTINLGNEFLKGHGASCMPVSGPSIEGHDGVFCIQPGDSAAAFTNVITLLRLIEEIQGVGFTHLRDGDIPKTLVEVVADLADMKRES